MSADTSLMPIPGADRSCARAARGEAARRRAGRARRPVEGPDPRRARGGRAGAEAGQAARQAGLALDLQSRRHRFRGDERHRQAAARLVRRALRDLAARGGRGAGLDRRHAQMAAEDPRRPRFRDGVHPRRRPRHLCVSSQVGCTLNCRFCHTGTMQLVRNLEPAEIVGQVMLARDALGEWPSASPRAGC